MRWFEADILDLRSLAAFRILYGSYLLWDMYSRLSVGKYDWAWYTSIPADRSLVSDEDSPHQAPLHKLWFYRGSLQTQQILFGITALLAVSYTVGVYQRRGILKIFLFIFLTAQQCRHMTGADGSDPFNRLLLLWTIFLPVDQIWSVDAFRHNCPKPHQYRVQGMACLGLTLQVAIMYWGTVMNRIESVNYDWRRCSWLPPRLDAVHYALSSTFSVRDIWLTRMIQRNPFLSRSMTFMAMLGETIGPLGCILGGSVRHYFAFLLFQLHLGLLINMNLPHWQIVGMITHAIFIPSQFWDRWCGANSLQRMDDEQYKKTDGDTERHSQSIPETNRLRSNPISKGLQIFFFSYAIYNFLANRGVIPKWDNGDIGEGIRISQNWIMFGTLDHNTHNVFVTGYDRTMETKTVDILRYLSDGTVHQQVPDWGIIPADMSRRYPSARYERALYKSAGSPNRRSMKTYCTAMCVLLNEESDLDLGRVELRFQHVRLFPPGGKTRFDASSRHETVVDAVCS